MKKFLLPTIILFSVLTSNAQDFYVGPKLGGAGVSFFTSSPSGIRPNLGGGFIAGGFFRVHNRKFFFQPELEYKFGTGSLIYDDKANTKQQISFSQISIPVLLGMKIPLDHKNTNYFRVYGGGSLGLMITGMNQKSQAVQSATGYISSYYGGRMEPWAWSWLVGAGIDIGDFMIDFKYDMIWNNLAPVYTDQTISLRANTFALGLSYRFKLRIGEGHLGHNSKSSTTN